MSKEPKIAKVRIDLLLCDLHLAESREKAKAILMTGEVFVNGQRVDKAGAQVPANAQVEIRGRGLPYASRGGFKIEKALDIFSVDVAGKTAADVGASTGGFTHCLLQRGASMVYAIDVGYGQLDVRLQNDERVVVMDRTNARYLEPQQFPQPPQLVSIDVSFISLKLILPAVKRIIAPGGQVVCLIKPQFEAGRDHVGKGGVVRNPAVHERVLQEVLECAASLGFTLQGVTYSPIKGPAGNREFLALLQAPTADEETYCSSPALEFGETQIHDLVEKAWREL